MLKEDNTGFVSFPIAGKFFNKIEEGKTLVYMVSIDAQDFSDVPYELSNVRLNLPGEFVSDDINFRKRAQTSKVSLDEFITENESGERLYFPKTRKNTLSIPFTSCVCVGWCDGYFETRDLSVTWSANFRDLTHEGRKLYYSLKKLHNNKEIRILTFISG